MCDTYYKCFFYKGAFHRVRYFYDGFYGWQFGECASPWGGGGGVPWYTILYEVVLYDTV